MAKILIIDDDKHMNDALCRVIRKKLGHEVKPCFSLEEGLKEARMHDYDLVLLDVILPDGNGIKLLHRFRELLYSPEIIILTGNPDKEGVQNAIESGAWDYIVKPFSTSEMLELLEQAIESRKATQKSLSDKNLFLEGIVGSSFKMRKCYEKVSQAAELESNVLITGETGTGKELFAKAIHKNSQRAQNNFEVVDCTVIPENLVESLLFGHEKGAFTGADTSREGLIQKAHGGTLFLDEIGELPLNIQKKFLRVLQERSYRRVGGTKEMICHFRLIAATNKDLDKMVEQKVFREDLFFRLGTITINLPSLRERIEDIQDLMDHYLKIYFQTSGIPEKKVSKGFLNALKSYPWPGNVRELTNTLEYAISAAKNASNLLLNHLPLNIRIQCAQKKISQLPTRCNNFKKTTDSKILTLKKYRTEQIAQIETHYLEKLLIITNGDLKQAQKISGLSRSRLYRLLKVYDVKAPGKN